MLLIIAAGWMVVVPAAFEFGGWSASRSIVLGILSGPGWLLLGLAIAALVRLRRLRG